MLYSFIYQVVFYPNVESKPMTINGSDFDGTSFTLLQFHLHWGYNDHQGYFTNIFAKRRYLNF